MLFIVIGHYIYWFLVNPYKNHTPLVNNFVDYSMLECIRLIASTAVDIYIMITGYFMITKTSFRIKGILRTWIITVIYGITLYFICSYITDNSIIISDLITNILPITYGRYWFVQKYIGLMLLAPFLSKLANVISQKEYIILLLITFILFIDIPVREPFDTGNVCSLSWFIFLYLLAGYLKLYGTPAFISDNILYIFLLTLLGMYCVATFINFYNFDNDFTKYILYCTGPSGIIVILAVQIFIIFNKWHPQKKIVNQISKLAPYTFGVYLIHEYRPLADIIWNHIVPKTLFCKDYLFVHCIIISIILFMICLCIDYLRSIIWPKTLK